MSSDARAKAVRLIVETLDLYPNYRVDYRSCWANLTDAVACFDPDAAAILRDPDGDIGALHDELLAREEAAAAVPAPVAGEREEKRTVCSAPGCTHDPSLVCLRCRDFDVTTVPAPAPDAVREAAERLRATLDRTCGKYLGGPRLPLVNDLEEHAARLLAALDARGGGE